MVLENWWCLVAHKAATEAHDNGLRKKLKTTITSRTSRNAFAFTYSNYVHFACETRSLKLISTFSANILQSMMQSYQRTTEAVFP